MQYTRLTFNSKNWKMPTGLAGKSSNQDCFEGKHHFGFEEWLFDQSTLINGMKYAFLQGVAKSTKLRNFPKELILYTLNKQTKERLHIATLKKWEYFVDDDILNIQERFEKKGWISQMRKQIQAVNGNVKMFDEIVAGNGTEPLFNVRFEFKDLYILPQPKVFPKGHRIYGLNRYNIYEF
jgi:hypothetical protein